MFISIFCMLQYGKIVSYWHCMLSNAIYTASANCDCKKILLDDIDGIETALSGNISLKEKVEELYTFQWMQTVKAKVQPIFSFVFSNNTSLLPPGFHALVFQPPKV